jgi:hypothetical protein
MYQVLRPIYEKTGEVTPTREGRDIRWERVAKWLQIGTAIDMEHAKEQFGGSPVLAEIAAVRRVQ